MAWYKSNISLGGGKDFVPDGKEFYCSGINYSGIQNDSNLANTHTTTYYYAMIELHIIKATTSYTKVKARVTEGMNGNISIYGVKNGTTRYLAGANITTTQQTFNFSSYRSSYDYIYVTISKQNASVNDGSSRIEWFFE